MKQSDSKRQKTSKKNDRRFIAAILEHLGKSVRPLFPIDYQMSTADAQQIAGKIAFLHSSVRFTVEIGLPIDD